jgi:hypothetical protein
MVCALLSGTTDVRAGSSDTWADDLEIEDAIQRSVEHNLEEIQTARAYGARRVTLTGWVNDEVWGELFTRTNWDAIYLTNVQGLTALPSEIGSCQELRTLCMKNCDTLASLPSSLGTLQALTHLEFRGCRSLAGLPSTIGDLTGLTRLSFVDCGLRSLPAALKERKRQKTLTVLTGLNTPDAPERSGTTQGEQAGGGAAAVPAEGDQEDMTGREPPADFSWDGVARTSAGRAGSQ